MFLNLVYFPIMPSCSSTYSHSSLLYRCDLGSSIRDVASRRLPDRPEYCHGDFFSRRHPDEDAEDVDSAADHLQFDHRCSMTTIFGNLEFIFVIQKKHLILKS